MQPYTSEIHNEDYVRSKQSANVILPMVIGKHPGISSIVDVGGGLGAWLHAGFDHGIEDLMLIDADYVTLDEVKCKEIRLINYNLENNLPNATKQYGLAISVEVAEHLSEARADSFVGDLCKLSKLVLFSAAIPGQGGHKHVNEQWLSYWVEKFQSNNYFPDDFIRSQIWENSDVEWWYRQNIILFQEGHDASLLSPLDLVHPEQFLHVQKMTTMKSRFRKIFSIGFYKKP
jgi:hypothetical protein